MFLDGMIYATISRNMSIGLGSIWKPFYTITWNDFHEHPPLALWLESLVFRMTGDSIYAERIYSFAMFVFTGGVMTLIWKRVTNSLTYGWLPLFFWITIPTVSWACSSNMLENTMMVFTSLSVYFYLRKDDRFYFIALSGLCLFLAFLSKGVFALFILSLPLWMKVLGTEAKWGKAILSGMVLLLLTIVPFFIFALIDQEIIASLKTYMDQQVIRSVKNVQTVDHRWKILEKMFSDLLPALIISVIMVLFGLQKKWIDKKSMNSNRAWALTFFFLALSGVLPIMISLKQSSFYIMATFPIFSLAFGLYMLPVIERIFDRVQPGTTAWLKWISIALLIGGTILSIAQSGRIGRDHEEMKDLYTTLDVIPRESVISMSVDLSEEWQIYARYSRYGQVTVTTDQENLQNYYLTGKNSHIVPQGFTKVPLQTTLYDLYKRASQP